MTQPSGQVAGFTLHADGGLAVAGRLTFDTVPEVLRQTADWIARASDAITVDLAEVERVDSAGVALMIEWMRLARERGRSVSFARLSDQVREVIRVYGLSRAFGVNSSS